MKGEERVVLIVGKEIVLRKRKLDTEEQSQQSTNKEEEEAEQEVHDADFFVVRGGQPWLEEAPEAVHGERFRRTAVEDPKDADEDQSRSQSNRGQEDDQRTGACGDGACIDAGDGGLGHVPVVATCAVAAVHGVAVDRHLNVEVVGSGSGPLEGPRAYRVGFLRVRKASVHDLSV